jgi:hypothetical protein
MVDEEVLELSNDVAVVGVDELLEFTVELTPVRATLLAVLEEKISASGPSVELITYVPPPA